MQAEFAFIAEAADAQNGLFYVVRGGTDIWNTPAEAKFPFSIGPMSFIVRLTGDPSEVGNKVVLRSTVVDADGRSLGVEGEGEIELSAHPLDRTRAGSALIHFRLGFQVPSPGAYFFEVHGTAGRLCQVPFWVLQGS
ncbi:MAG: hypothetical protein KY429_06485 [Actinobacteria bacterium]|nr:hypothetical protein [Actinomycetota bacterium]